MLVISLVYVWQNTLCNIPLFCTSVIHTNPYIMHTEKSGAKMAPQWNFVVKLFHFVKVEPLSKAVLKQHWKVEPKWLHSGTIWKRY